jgi:catechol 2,3-dioxygenase-like lactoylglutathione lyase family enzyme
MIDPRWSHMALLVTDLQNAERFYSQLFDLQVQFREARTIDGWATLPPGAGWPEAIAAGIQLELSFLRNGALVLALERASEMTADSGRISHLAVTVDPAAMAELKRRAAELGCQITLDHPRTLLFMDPFGIRWELEAADGQFRSTGEQIGRWLDLTPNPHHPKR